MIAFLQRLFGSRKMILGLFGLISIVATMLLPNVPPSQIASICLTIALLVGVISGTIAYEDSARIKSEFPTTLGEAIDYLRDELAVGEKDDAQ